LTVRTVAVAWTHA